MARLLDEGPVLLVLLDERKGELEASLAAISPFDAKLGASPTGSNLAFKTELRDVRSVLAQLAQHRTSATGTIKGLAKDLLFKPCFVVPLRKREGSTSLFAERITVGRARNHDVVLRHRSVSKFHAWFERDGKDGMKVGDAGSSNHTYVDGVKVTDAPLPLRCGANVKFGSVEAVFATFDALWSLVSQAEM